MRFHYTSKQRDEGATAVLALGDLGADTKPWLDDDAPAVRSCAALGLPIDSEATDKLITTWVTRAGLTARLSTTLPALPAM